MHLGFKRIFTFKRYAYILITIGIVFNVGVVELNKCTSVLSA